MQQFLILGIGGPTGFSPGPFEGSGEDDLVITATLEVATIGHLKIISSFTVAPNGADIPITSLVTVDPDGDDLAITSSFTTDVT